MATDKQLDILHDHYKETFTRIREVEQARDRLFLWVIGLFALLSLEIGYPAAVGGSLGKVSIAGAELNLQALPLPALLNATWVLTLAISLRYCQDTVFVTRQYSYLQMLEENISRLVRHAESLPGSASSGPGLDETVYRREGKVYLDEYPPLLNLAWFAYVILFPVIVIVATIWLTASEWVGLRYPLAHRVVDMAIACSLVLVFICYRLAPNLAMKVGAWRKQRPARKRSQSKHEEVLRGAPGTRINAP